MIQTRRCIVYVVQRRFTYFLARCTFSLFDWLGSYVTCLPTSMNTNVTNVRIKGRYFYPNQTVPAGTVLELEREPTNLRDPNAIKVTYAGRPNEVVGNVFAKHAGTLAPRTWTAGSTTWTTPLPFPRSSSLEASGTPITT